MADMSVSVIIPAYNAAKTIGRALDSLNAQTRRPNEILVIDDGSEDDLPAALAPYGRCVTLVRKPNGGAGSARNLGIDLARGRLIAFLDADDYWEADKLAKQYSVFERHPDVGLCAACYYVEIPGTARRIWPVEFNVRFDQPVAVRGAEAFEFGMMIWTSTVLVRRDVLGNHRFERELRTAEDRDLWIRLVSSCPVYVTSECLATLVAEPGSLSRSNVSADYANMLRVIRRHGDLLSHAERRRWEARVFRLWAAGHLGGGRPNEALVPAWNRLLRQPLSVEGWWVLLKSATLTCTGTKP